MYYQGDKYCTKKEIVPWLFGKKLAVRNIFACVPKRTTRSGPPRIYIRKQVLGAGLSDAADSSEAAHANDDMPQKNCLFFCIRDMYLQAALGLKCTEQYIEELSNLDIADRHRSSEPVNRELLKLRFFFWTGRASRDIGKHVNKLENELKDVLNAYHDDKFDRYISRFAMFYWGFNAKRSPGVHFPDEVCKVIWEQLP